MATPTFRNLDVDGVRIAYWTLGDGPPLFITPGSTFSDTQGEWDFPPSRAYYQALARKWTVVRYDPRGVGRSERHPPTMRAEDHIADLTAVLEAADAPVTLLADGWFAGYGLRYAAHNPDRIRSLLLWHPLIDLHELFEGEATAGWLAMARAGWDAVIPAAVSANYRCPPEFEQEMISWMTASCDQDGLFRFIDESLLDARADGADVRSPTRILIRPRVTNLPLDQAREVAAAIPSAELRLLEGVSTTTYFGDVDAVIAEINAVYPESPTPDQSDAPGGFRTILFTDVENSTDLVVQHGDTKYRQLLADHERLVREALAEHGGNEIKTMGDSFMCWFSSASSALGAAQAMQRKITDHYGDGLRIRIGIHAGEPIQEADGDLYGTSVVRASRIMGQADGGQILVSQVVTDLVEGKGYLFSDAGEFALKGYERAVHLFDVAWEGE